MEGFLFYLKYPIQCLINKPTIAAKEIPRMLFVTKQFKSKSFNFNLKKFVL